MIYSKKSNIANVNDCLCEIKWFYSLSDFVDPSVGLAPADFRGAHTQQRRPLYGRTRQRAEGEKTVLDPFNMIVL